MRFRRGVVLAAVLAAGAAQAATAQAATTASATTTSGQTLTTTIDGPADGSDSLWSPDIVLRGTATLSGPTSGKAVTVDRVDIGIDVRDWADPVTPDAAGNWSYSTVYLGTHTYTATAVTSDGTSATATVRFRTTQETRVTAYPGISVDPAGQPGLSADLWLPGGSASSFFGGRTMQFFVAGLKVCEARTTQYGHFQGTATCSDPAAMAAATAAGGFTAVYPGDDDWLGSSDFASLTEVVGTQLPQEPEAASSTK
jgi:hypothetical protein